VPPASPSPTLAPPTVVPTSVPTPTAAPPSPEDAALRNELVTYLGGFVDATWYRHITGVSVRGNLLGVQTDFPNDGGGKRQASPLCGAVSLFTIERAIPGWEVLVYGVEGRPLHWRVGVTGPCY